MDFAVPPYEGDSDARWAYFKRPFPLVVDGALVDGEETMPIESPRDRAVVGQVAVPGTVQIAEATAAARRAFDEGPWPRMSGRDRARALQRVAELVEKHADELAFLDAVDGGKILGNVYSNDLQISLESLDYFAARAQTVEGRTAQLSAPGVRHRSRVEPVGVVLEILPWNGPLWTGVQRIAAILAAGNVAVAKPAELAQASFLRFAQLVLEADLPPGALTVLPGTGPTVGEALVTDPAIDLVSFTGGVATGRRILALAAPLLRRVSLELGGKNPCIVCADADLDAAVQWTAIGSFANAGQICVCASRVFVERPIYADFLARLSAAADQIVVGDPLQPDTTMGPVIGPTQYAKVWRYVDIARRDARIVRGGEEFSDTSRKRGYYIPPTIVADAPVSCPVVTDEIFGPVVVVLPFDSVDDAIQLANDTSYGLAAGLFTRDVGKAEQIGDALQAGQVYVNQWFSPGVLEAPSQGYKHSGYGGVGMEKYQQVKNVFLRVE